MLLGVLITVHKTKGWFDFACPVRAMRRALVAKLMSYQMSYLMIDLTIDLMSDPWLTLIASTNEFNVSASDTPSSPVAGDTRTIAAISGRSEGHTSRHKIATPGVVSCRAVDITSIVLETGTQRQFLSLVSTHRSYTNKTQQTYVARERV